MKILPNTPTSTSSPTLPGESQPNFVAGAHQAVDRLSDAATQAGTLINERSAQLKTQGAAMVDCTRDYVVRKPLTAIGIAVATGFVLGHILSGSR